MVAGTPTTERILELVTRYRYMTRSQIIRKLWKRSMPRQAQTNLSKHFSEAIVAELVSGRRLRRSERGVFSTTARGAGSTHQEAIVDRILDLEEAAEARGLDHWFTYEQISPELHPDAAMIFRTGRHGLLCFLEVDLGHEVLFDRRKYSVEEKFSKYMRAADLREGSMAAYEWWRRYAASEKIPAGSVERFGFRVAVFADRKLSLPDTRFVQLPARGGELEAVFAE